MKQNKPIKKSIRMYEMLAEICGAMANPVRLQILDLLATNEMTNSELLLELNIPKPNLTQHLNVLKEAGLLVARKEGLYSFCSLAVPQILDACGLMCGVLGEKIITKEREGTDLKKELVTIKRQIKSSFKRRNK